MKHIKSIKEKAEEFVFIKYGIDSGGIQFRELNTNKQDGFVAGANYVLECIEGIIVNNEDNTLNMARCLVDCIEQLKK